jgi:hypothetical protein
MNEQDLQKRQKQIDSRIGYCILAIIALLIFSLLGYGFFLIKQPAIIQIISFEQTGNLKIDDPVYLKGIKVGKVNSIVLGKNNRTLVSFASRNPINLHHGYHIEIKDVGIMGDRMVYIDFGDTAMPLVSATDTLIGVFNEGLSGAVGMVWKLHSIVDSFMNMSAKMLQGTPTQASLVQQINKIVLTMDSSTHFVEIALQQLSAGLSGGLDSLNRVIKDINRLGHAADSLSKLKLPNWDQQIISLEKGLVKLEVIIGNLITAARKLEGIESSSEKGKISQFIDKMKTLRDALLHIKDGFIQLKKLNLNPT